jgi:hypothetical protein
VGRIEHSPLERERGMEGDEKPHRPRPPRVWFSMMLLVTLCCVVVVFLYAFRNNTKAMGVAEKPAPTATLPSPFSPTPSPVPNDQLLISTNSHPTDFTDVRLIQYQGYGDFRAQGGCSCTADGRGLAPLSDGYYYCALLRRVPNPTMSTVELVVFRSREATLVAAPLQGQQSKQPPQLVEFAMKSATLVVNRTYVGLPSFEISCCSFSNASRVVEDQRDSTSTSNPPTPSSTPVCVTDTSNFRSLRVHDEESSTKSPSLTFGVSDPPAQGWECVMTWRVSLLDGCAMLIYEDDCGISRA